MRAPEFWRRDGVLARVLAPLGAVYAAVTARRVARPGWVAPVPVLCVGNAGVGGTGKTTVALDLGGRLIARGRRVGFLTRGYGGAARGVVRVDPAVHGAAEVGDEALLLAGCAPTFLGADRVAAARLAVADGVDVLVMDDGLQNPGLAKTVSLLLVDGVAGFGNGRVIPAGPLREPVAAAAARCAAAVVIGGEAVAGLPAWLPVLRARLVSEVPPAGPLLAFAGIGRPEKFRETLTAAGGEVVRLVGFADHHPYTEAELRPLLADGGTVVTTPKDFVRVPAVLRPFIVPVGVRLDWLDSPEPLLERLA